MFVFPLLLVAGVTGLAVRLVRPLLRRGSGRRLPVPPYLALRRLGAARGLLVVLAVVSAVSFGAFFYAETLADLARADDRREGVHRERQRRGGDRPGLRGAAAQLPVPGDEDRVRATAPARRTRSIGQQLDVLVVDPRALPARAALAERLGARPDPRCSRKLAARAGDAAAGDRRPTDAPPMRAIVAPGHAGSGRRASARVHVVPGDEPRTRS